MSPQAQRAWVGLLRGHSSLLRELNSQLQAAHGLTISDYEVLLRLANAPDGTMRRVDLAQSVLLTPSGITRLLEGLERCGYVERGSCDSDRRVTYAILTESGLEKLQTARESHLEDLQRLFASRFSEGELETLAGLLVRLSAEDGECGTEET